MTTTTRPEPTVLPQGDLRLLQEPTAQRLLNSSALARLAYVAHDGSPRLIPIGFLWTGSDVVMVTYPSSAKIAALRRRPEVALTIDVLGPPPEVLMLRGEVTLEPAGGVPDEYRQIQLRSYGEEVADASVRNLETAGIQMTKLVLHPTWVGLLDFQTRLPGAMSAAMG
jgi:Pyridoxamine 5'-phosphate oxidase